MLMNKMRILRSFYDNNNAISIVNYKNLKIMNLSINEVLKYLNKNKFIFNLSL